MRNLFLLGVIVYSALQLILNHWPAAINAVGAASFPWMGLMVVDGAFAAVALFRLLGPAFFEAEDEETKELASDITVPDSWFYGIFGLDLLANFGWHAYKFAFTTGTDSFGYSLWFIVEAVALFLTWVFFQAAQHKAARERKARRVAGNA